MPFDVDPKEPRETKVKLKQVSSQKSMFENMPKKPTPQEFQQQVQQAQEKSSTYKKRASELATQFAKMMADKTLPENKNLFAIEAKRELLSNMVQLAKDINNDPNELEGDGSLIWIIVLFNTCFDQRDRINKLEYALTQIQKTLDSTMLTDLISKEITKVLDSKKTSE
jgi:DNA repair ATPase RecN